MFEGLANGEFRASAADTGKILKSLDTGSAIMAAPSTYTVVEALHAYLIDEGRKAYEDEQKRRQHAGLFVADCLLQPLLAFRMPGQAADSDRDCRFIPIKGHRIFGGYEPEAGGSFLGCGFPGIEMRRPLHR